MVYLQLLGGFVLPESREQGSRFFPAPPLYQYVIERVQRVSNPSRWRKRPFVLAYYQLVTCDSCPLQTPLVMGSDFV